MLTTALPHVNFSNPTIEGIIHKKYDDFIINTHTEVSNAAASLSQAKIQDHGFNLTTWSSAGNLIREERPAVT